MEDNEDEDIEKQHTDKKDKEKEGEYPEGGIDGMMLRDGAPVEYPLPDPSGIVFTDPMDTARVELKKLRETPDIAIRSMETAVELVKGMEDYDRERMKILHLDTKNRLLAIENIATGTINQAIIHPREAVKGAVLSNATSVIVVHNHPSGKPAPSPEDVNLLRNLVNAFDLMNIDILDFIIIGKEGVVSFKGAGTMPAPEKPVVKGFDIGENDSEECQLALRAAREVLEEQCGR